MVDTIQFLLIIAALWYAVRPRSATPAAPVEMPPVLVDLRGLNERRKELEIAIAALNTGSPEERLRKAKAILAHRRETRQRWLAQQ